MDPTILPLLAGLGGTFLGGAIAYINASVQWKRQQAALRKQALSGKLETVCELVTDIRIGLSHAWGETLLRIQGVESSTKDMERIPLERLTMLVSLYFESLIPHAEAVVEGRDQLGAHIANSIARPPSNTTERQAARQQATAAHELAKKACDDFLAEAARIAKTFL